MWKLSKGATKEKYIPVGDCPKCGLKDTPFSGKGHLMTHKDTKKQLDFITISCPKCDHLINFDKKTMKAVKGYISIQDMLDAGYKTMEHSFDGHYD
jgi:hypothetical protein